MGEAERVIDLARGVPGEDAEIDAPPAARQGGGGEIGHQGAADAAAARRFGDEDVLEEETGPPFPGRVVREEQGKADRLAVDEGEPRLEAPVEPEPVAPEILLGRLDHR